MMLKRRKKNSGGGAPEWMVTYSDMVTLLLTFFVLLYSFSNLDAEKFKTFLASFQGQGILSYSNAPFEEYASGPNFEASEKPLANEDSSILTLDTNTARTLAAVQNFIEEMGLEAEVTVRAEERGVALNIKDWILFDSGKADLKPEAKQILDPLAKLFGTIKQEIWVEGHTDNRPINTREYPTNWELSTARSSRVIRYFVSKGLDPGKFVAIGYGEYRPVAPNDSPENMQKNRRVVMIIRMPANETEVNADE
jgi:chemotaxis protein MotB